MKLKVNPRPSSRARCLVALIAIVTAVAVAGVSSASARAVGVPTVMTPTSTSVSCAPVALPVGSTTTCTATVAFAEATSGPTGTVTFGSNAEGGFSPSSCTLVSVEGKRASSCHVAYTPVVTGTNRITASYGGDARGLPSQGSTVVEAGPQSKPQPTATQVSCSPAVLSVGSTTTCTATVLTEGPSGPTGRVTFGSNVEGGFSPSSCTLVSVEGKRASSCHVTYTPVVTGNNRITASYGGDAGDLASQGSTVVEAGPLAEGFPILK